MRHHKQHLILLVLTFIVVTQLQAQYVPIESKDGTVYAIKPEVAQLSETMTRFISNVGFKTPDETMVMNKYDSDQLWPVIKYWTALYNAYKKRLPSFDPMNSSDRNAYKKEIIEELAQHIADDTAKIEDESLAREQLVDILFISDYFKIPELVAAAAQIAKSTVTLTEILKYADKKLNNKEIEEDIIAYVCANFKKSCYPFVCYEKITAPFNWNEERAQFAGPGATLKAGASPGGKMVTSKSYGEKDELLIQDTRTHKTLISMPLHGYTPTFNHFIKDGKILLTASNEGDLKVWDVETGSCLETYEINKDGLTMLSTNKAETVVLARILDGGFCIWDLDTKTCIFRAQGHEAKVNRATLDASERYVLTASQDCTAKLWDLSQGVPIVTYTGHEDILYDAVASPDGTLVATSSDDNTVKLWNRDTGECIRTKQFNVYAATVTFTEDSKGLIVNRCYGRISILRVEDFETVLAYSPTSTLFHRIVPSDAIKAQDYKYEDFKKYFKRAPFTLKQAMLIKLLDDERAMKDRTKTLKNIAKKNNIAYELLSNILASFDTIMQKKLAKTYLDGSLPGKIVDLIT